MEIVYYTKYKQSQLLGNNSSCSDSPKPTIGVASIVGISIFAILIVVILFVVLISIDCKHVCKSRWVKVRPYLWERRQAEQDRLKVEGRLGISTDRMKTPRWRRNLQVATNQGIEGKPGVQPIIKQTTELKPILKNKNNPLIERIDPVSEDNNES